MRGIVSAIIILVLVCHVQSQCKAGRVLHEAEEREVMKTNSNMKMVLQSLERGPVPPSGPSGCTYIPGTSGPKCP